MAKKKEKITYIDDGRTIADMSGVRGGFTGHKRPERQPSHRFKDIWQTYWTAVKMMLRPMLVVVVGMVLIYVIVYILFTRM